MRANSGIFKNAYCVNPWDLETIYKDGEVDDQFYKFYVAAHI